MSGAIKWGDDIRLNAEFGGGQSDPQIVALADGGFAASWSSFPDDGVSNDVHVQCFDADGGRRGAEYVLHGDAYGPNPSIAALSDGGFVVAWSSYPSTGESQIRAQLFEPTGAASGSQLVLGTSPIDDALGLVDIAARGDGFVATWNFSQGSTGTTSATVQAFNRDGSILGSAISLASSNATDLDPHVASLADGRLVVAWDDFSSDDIHAKILNAAGTTSVAEFTVNAGVQGSQYEPNVAALRSGGFAAIWSDTSSGDPDIRAQIFDADGNRVGAEILVNTTTDHAQYSPVIAQLADGRLVAAWTDTSNNSASGYHQDIRGQVLNLDGTRSGDEFVANTSSAGIRSSPTITALADGRFVVGWDDDTKTSGHRGLGEHAQIFDPRDAAVHLTGTPRDDDFVGTAFDDTMEGRGGNDHLDGGGGDDTAIFAHPRSQYTVTQQDGATIVSGPDGTDTLISFEHLQFADETAPPSAPPQSSPAPSADPGIIGHAVNGFDAKWYLFHNPDVAAAGIDPLQHYQQSGWHEGRNPNPWFDKAGYLAHYADVAAAGVDPLQHYEQFGWKEGRDPSAGFGTNGYLAANPDVAAAHVNPLDHFINNGIYEGRAAVSDGWH